MAEGSGKADEEAHDRGDGAPYHRAGGSAVGEGVEQLRSYQTVQGLVELSVRQDCMRDCVPDLPWMNVLFRMKNRAVTLYAALEPPNSF